MARPSGRDIRQAAIDEATDAIRARGVTGFSYGDLARRIGVKAPSLHHHFPRKDELVAETAARYRQAFRSRVAELDREAQPLDRVRRYCELFLEPADQEVLCLCGAAVAGWDELSQAARQEIVAFFDGEIHWLTEQLSLAQERGAIRAEVDAAELAVSLVSALEGALLLARTGVATGTGAGAAARVPATLLALAAS